LSETARLLPDAPAYTVLDIRGGLTESVTRVTITPIPSRESILRAVFWQALSGRRLQLPPGTTREMLKDALALDDAEIARIFYHVKELAAEAARAAAAPPDPPPVTAPPPAAQKTPLREAKTVARQLPKPAPVPFTAATPPSAAARKPSWKQPLAAILLAAFGIAAVALAPLFQPAKPLVLPPPPQTQAAYLGLLAHAQAGDPESEFLLARVLDRRFTPTETVAPKNDALAFEWYNQAALAGFVPAQAALGYAYLNGHGVPRDTAQAARWDAAAAAAGDPQAEENLATAYRYGEGVKPDMEAAARYYALAAAAGDASAANSLGFLAYTGAGIPKNYAQAAQLFTQAAHAGLPEAEVNLGLSYATGNGLPKNPELGAAWALAGLAHGAQTANTALAVITPLLTPQQLAAAKAQAMMLK